MTDFCVKAASDLLLEASDLLQQGFTPVEIEKIILAKQNKMFISPNILDCTVLPNQNLLQRSGAKTYHFGKIKTSALT